MEEFDRVSLRLDAMRGVLGRKGRGRVVVVRRVVLRGNGEEWVESWVEQ
jgi:hypothetical protein